VCRSARVDLVGRVVENRRVSSSPAPPSYEDLTALVGVLGTKVEALTARVEELEAENAGLRAENASCGPRTLN
jgi:hypothetical protein